MADALDRVTDALVDNFKRQVSSWDNVPFEKTGVSVNRKVFRRYAAAALLAVRDCSPSEITANNTELERIAIDG